MAAGQDFLASIAASATGNNLQAVVTSLQNLVTALNALNAALTAAIAGIASDG